MSKAQSDKMKKNWELRKLNGYIQWNKGKKGVYTLTEEHKKNIRASAPKGTDNKTWKGGLPECLNCKKRLSSYVAKRCLKCHRIIMKQKGEKHFNWKEDRSKIKTVEKHGYDANYKHWMFSVKKRDGWKCKISNGDCKGRLEAHHILRWSDFRELRYDIKNGITLCQFHHPKGRNKERSTEYMFRELIKQSLIK